jgi:plasmid stabilization system protein ParE
MILFSSDAISDIERVRNFLEVRNPQAAVRAMRAIWVALGRVESAPYLGKATDDRGIRQIVVDFGRRGYIVRYRVLPPDDAIFVTRIWHGREKRQ